MNFVGGERGYFDKEEQEEEEAMSSKLPFASPCTSSSCSKYKNFLPEHQNLWPRLFDQPRQDSETQEPSLNFDKKLEFMELSLGNNNESESSSTDAGGGASDIVSFQRGVGETGKHRLFIDWRRRPNAPDPTSFSHLELQNQLHYPQSLRWGRLYSMPQSNLHMQQPQLQHLNYSIHPYQQHQHHNHQYPYHQPSTISYGNAAQYYLRPPASTLPIGAVHEQGGSHVPVVIDSVPVVHGKTVGKRLRLFGVNMECPTQNDPSSSVTMIRHGTLDSLSPRLASSSLPPLQVREPTGAPMQAEYSKKGKASLSFDLDL
ncbi:hypothetical protein D5086_026109 [Populus alba]|uniref:Uncharacterized protein n=1 Tax=Populus alba TaxID=43335 RepID=A0ACC4B1H4_POPAL